MRLKDNVAIITGGARGIGLGIAETYAKEGCSVVICDIAEDASVKAAQDIASKYNVKTLGIKTDVSNFEETKELAAKVQKEFGRIDILVNNAGITRDNLLLRMTPDDWDKVININLNSVFNCTKNVIRTMLKQKSGKIINMASVVGVMGNPGQANYSASKAGIIGFTKTIAKEFGAKGISCNAIAPGFIQTDMIESLPKEYIDNIISAVPQKRLGSIQDVANVALFLACDLGAYLTGQVINVDGGMVM
jgi:3-oxoacyl-[acyl-carrier protein] reductase